MALSAFEDIFERVIRAKNSEMALAAAKEDIRLMK